MMRSTVMRCLLSGIFGLCLAGCFGSSDRDDTDAAASAWPVRNDGRDGPDGRDDGRDGPDGAARREAPRERSRASDLTNREGRLTGTVPLESIPILKQVLPRQTYYTIDRDVQYDGYFYVFTVRTRDGRAQEIRSVRRLVKVCHEINVVEHFRENDPGGHAGEAFAQSAKGVGRGLFNVVRHPGQTVKNVGTSTKNLASRAGRIGKKTLSDDGDDLGLLGSGPAGGERRQLCAQLGIDVYTESEPVRETINRIARQRLAGKLPVSSAVFALPGGVVFTLSLTPAGFDETTETLIRDNDPGSLLDRLAREYERTLGFDARDPNAPARLLLDNGNFTPRDQAYLQLYCTDMRGVRGVEETLSFLAQASHPDYAKIVTAQMELLSLLHQRARPLDRLVPVRNTVGAVSADGVMMFVISIDTVRYWDDVRLSIDAALEAGRREGAHTVEIWSTGDMDRRTMEEGERRGVRMMQNILAQDMFRRPRSDARGVAPVARTVSAPVSEEPLRIPARPAERSLDRSTTEPYGAPPPGSAPVSRPSAAEIMR